MKAKCAVLAVGMAVGLIGHSGAIAATFSNEQICAAGIAAMMGRAPKIVKTTRVEGATFHMNYHRPDDNSYWGYRCTIEGNRVMWAAEGGRWRRHPADEVITFAVDGSKLHIRQTTAELALQGGDLVPKQPLKTQTKVLATYTMDKLPVPRKLP